MLQSLASLIGSFQKGKLMTTEQQDKKNTINTRITKCKPPCMNSFTKVTQKVFKPLLVSPLCMHPFINDLAFKAIPLKSSILDSINSTNLENTRQIVLFVGGFLDSIHQRMFKNFLDFNSQNAIKLYITFNSSFLLFSFLPRIYGLNLPFSIIAHSWGTDNLLQILNAIESNHIHTLITLDVVGKSPITKRAQGIRFWENLYINDQFTHFYNSNLVAIIGGIRGAISLADCNIALNHPHNHASVKAMLEHSRIFSQLVLCD